MSEELAPLWGTYIKAALCTVLKKKSRLFQETQEVVVCCVVLSWDEHDNHAGMIPPHTAAGEALTSTVRSVSTEPKPCRGKLNIFTSFPCSFPPSLTHILSSPYFHTCHTHITCVRRVERCWQTGPLMCVCLVHLSQNVWPKVARREQWRTATDPTDSTLAD